VTIHLQLCLLVSYFFRLICKFGANIWRRHHVSLIVNTKCAWTSPVSRSAVGDRGNTTGRRPETGIPTDATRGCWGALAERGALPVLPRRWKLAAVCARVRHTRSLRSCVPMVCVDIYAERDILESIRWVTKFRVFRGKTARSEREWHPPRWHRASPARGKNP
jgi:hypothetical protein